jgi:hypothetical protein
MEITGCVYRDSMDYVYQTLGRMVKAGLIRRSGSGVFEAAEGGEMIWITFCIAWVAAIGWIVWGIFEGME